MKQVNLSDRNSRQRSNFVLQGTILAAAGIIVRLIGILYRVPMTNIIGDEGMGYYSTAFNVYNIMLILSSYSLPVAVSRMLSARLAKNEYRNAARVLQAALAYATVAGGISCAITWFFADFFAGSVFDTPLAVYALKTLAPTIWIMAYLGVLRGFFQGHGTMVPTAISQILEQIVNAIVSVAAAGFLFAAGLKASEAMGKEGYAEAYGAAGGTLGTGSGAFAALLFVAVLFIIYLPVFKNRVTRDTGDHPESFRQVSSALLFTVIPVLLSSAVYNINSVIDNGIMAHGMRATGQGASFLRLWGIYNNKYMLLVHVPLAMANSLSSSLIPSLSAASSREDTKEMVEKTSLVIRVAMLIAIPAAVGLTVLAGPVMNLLFRSGRNADGIRMLTVGSAAVVFLSLSTVTNAVLQGLGHMREPVKNAFISLVLHIGVLAVLLFVFRMGIYSMVFASIFFAIAMCVLNQRSIRKHIPYRQEIRKTFLLPAAASAVMGIAALVVYYGVHRIIPSNLFGVVVSVACAVFAYMAVFLRLGGITEAELHSVRGGTRLLVLAKKLHLM